MSIPRVFDEASRSSLYRIMELRRDIRDFRPGEISEALLARILNAASLAPSVGYSQPWAFVVIRDADRRRRIRQSFLRCREAESARYPAERREKYLAYTLEGIESSTLNLCVVADLRAREGVILGTTVQPESVRASVCCAVQNLWLAARVEGLGVGWVSIVEPAVLRQELALPAGVEPIAYLCMGHPTEFRERPLLDETGWELRRDIAGLIHRDSWSETTPTAPKSHEAHDVRDLPDDANPQGARCVAALSSPPPRPEDEIPPFDEASRDASLAYQTELTKPVGSLGRLEELAGWYAACHGRFPPPPIERTRIVVFAADHGVAAEGVSAYPSSVTAAMVANVMSGGAAISCLCRHMGVDLTVVDVGVHGDLSAAPVEPVVELLSRRIGPGTANLRWGPAMTRSEVERALAIGAEVARAAAREPCQAVGIGEIGMGNTTSAAALVCALVGAPADEVVGYGTGISEAARAWKVGIVAEAAERARGLAPLDQLAALGGFEIAAMCGFLIEAARHRLPVVIDGFVAGAAAAVAKALAPACVPYMVLSHASVERGAVRVAAYLGAVPLLDLGLRLGEGTGAALGLALLKAAVATQLSMATFATAGIVGRPGIFPPG